MNDARFIADVVSAFDGVDLDSSRLGLVGYLCYVSIVCRNAGEDKCRLLVTGGECGDIARSVKALVDGGVRSSVVDKVIGTEVGAGDNSVGSGVAGSFVGTGSVGGECCGEQFDVARSGVASVVCRDDDVGVTSLRDECGTSGKSSVLNRGKNWEKNQEKKEKRRRNRLNRAVSRDKLSLNWRQGAPVSVVGKKPLFEDCSDDIKSQLVTSRAEMYIAKNKVETEKAERLAKELKFKRESRYDETELELKRQRNENSLRAALDKRFNGHGGSFARTLVDADLATTLGAPSLGSAGSGDISPNSSISVAELNRMEKKMVDMSKQIIDLTLALETEKFTSKTLSERVERLVEFGPSGDSRRMNTFKEELEAYPPLDSYSITTSQHEALADLDF